MTRDEKAAAGEALLALMTIDDALRGKTNAEELYRRTQAYVVDATRRAEAAESRAASLSARVEALREELARWERLEAYTAQDARQMREAFKRALAADALRGKTNEEIGTLLLEHVWATEVLGSPRELVISEAIARLRGEEAQP